MIRVARFCYYFVFILFTYFVYSQNGVLKGKVTDKITGEELIGANVILDGSGGTATDFEGNYELKVAAGKHNLKISSIGYKDQTKHINIEDGQTLILNIAMSSDEELLDEVVVTGTKHEVKLAKATVSIDIIKPSLIENRNTTELETAVDQVPGVNIIDGTANIRGGSGFTYGAGSRVLILLDDLPMLTADAADAMWDFMPLENIQQVEVIKGASSALYGSSALNGAINIRTAYPGDEPKTKINTYAGLYFTPEREEIAWWWRDSLPTHLGISHPRSTSGVNFSHSRKIKNFDLSVGGMLYNDDGYVFADVNQRYRLNANTRYRFQKIEGLTAGLNVNHQKTHGGNVLYWADADSNALIGYDGTLSIYDFFKTSIDPFVTYFKNNRTKYSVRGRYFGTSTNTDTDQDREAHLFYTEYLYQKFINEKVVLTTGLQTTISLANSDLFGKHKSYNYAGYAQIDWDINAKLKISGGLRTEYFKLDSVGNMSNFVFLNPNPEINDTAFVTPVLMRFGVNYQLLKYTFLRASYGQGYRNPSIGEKFIATNAGGFNIFPNPDLVSETGWSAEIGVKQGIKISNWQGFIDVAAYWTEYYNMIQFNLTVLDGDIGFKSINEGNARISGLDISLIGQGSIGPISVNTMMGYTYMNPVDLNYDPTDTNDTKMLKYRFYHSAKADIELGYKKLLTGISFRYNSNMEYIDDVFLFLIPGLGDYREEHNKGDYIIDHRISYQINEMHKIALITKNVLNREYTQRPAFIMPPRTMMLQYTLVF